MKRRLLCIAALLAQFGACRHEGPVKLSVTLTDSSGIRIVELSHTPGEVAERGISTPLALDLRLGGGDGGFGSVADITSMPGGRFAVLDRIENRVSIYGEDGQVEEHLGREGDGPGEFRYPLALTAVGDRLVVWQSRAVGTFTTFEPGGHVLAAVARPSEGDWERYAFRHPLLNLDGDQRGPEDVTRRLRAFGESAFVHQIQRNEFLLKHESPEGEESPPVYLVRYDLLGRVLGTLAVLAGPPTLAMEQIPGAPPLWTQPLFAGRPLWATGAGWIAIGHGDSTRVVVRDSSGDTVLIVRWPQRQRRTRVSDEDKLEAARWILAVRVMNSPTSLEILKASTRAERRQAVRGTAFELTPFSEFAPHLTALFGSGKCLFLSGYAPSDHPDGTSLTLIVVNVDSGSLEGVFRLSEPPGTPLEFHRPPLISIRGFGERRAFAVQRDGSGLSYVLRYVLTRLRCSTRL